MTPAIVRRRGVLLLDLDVPHGHWDGSYRFPLTALQAERSVAHRRALREGMNTVVVAQAVRRGLAGTPIGELALFSR